MTDFLKKSSYLELRAVKVSRDESRITLTGCVSSFYMKQMATTLAKKRFPNLELVNGLEVVASGKKVQGFS